MASNKDSSNTTRLKQKRGNVIGNFRVYNPVSRISGPNGNVDASILTETKIYQGLLVSSVPVIVRSESEIAIIENILIYVTDLVSITNGLADRIPQFVTLVAAATSNPSSPPTLIASTYVDDTYFFVSGNSNIINEVQTMLESVDPGRFTDLGFSAKISSLNAEQAITAVKTALQSGAAVTVLSQQAVALMTQTISTTRNLITTLQSAYA